MALIGLRWAGKPALRWISMRRVGKPAILLLHHRLIDMDPPLRAVVPSRAPAQLPALRDAGSEVTLPVGDVGWESD
jgi:hypothetical protein